LKECALVIAAELQSKKGCEVYKYVKKTYFSVIICALEIAAQIGGAYIEKYTNNGAAPASHKLCPRNRAQKLSPKSIQNG